MKYNSFLVFFILMVLMSCEEHVLPKPKAMLRLEYSRPALADIETDYFSFKYNQKAKFINENSHSFVLEYPEMKAAVFVNYQKVANDIDKLIANADRLSYEHAVKADRIMPRVFENSDDKVYGTFFEVSGDAASQAQFYVTDSTSHFVTGSLYFATKPNYDSIYPAVAYLQQDMGRIMETLQWKQ